MRTFFGPSKIKITWNRKGVLSVWLLSRIIIHKKEPTTTPCRTTKSSPKSTLATTAISLTLFDLSPSQEAMWWRGLVLILLWTLKCKITCATGPLESVSHYFVLVEHARTKRSVRIANTGLVFFIILEMTVLYCPIYWPCTVRLSWSWWLLGEIFYSIFSLCHYYFVSCFYRSFFSRVFARQ